MAIVEFIGRLDRVDHVDVRGESVRGNVLYLPHVPRGAGEHADIGGWGDEARGRAGGSGWKAGHPAVCVETRTTVGDRTTPDGDERAVVSGRQMGEVMSVMLEPEQSIATP